MQFIITYLFIIYYHERHGGCFALSGKKSSYFWDKLRMAFLHHPKVSLSPVRFLKPNFVGIRSSEQIFMLMVCIKVQPGLALNQMRRKKASVEMTMSGFQFRE